MQVRLVHSCSATRASLMLYLIQRRTSFSREVGLAQVANRCFNRVEHCAGAALLLELVLTTSAKVLPEVVTLHLAVARPRLHLSLPRLFCCCHNVDLLVESHGSIHLRLSTPLPLQRSSLARNHLHLLLVELPGQLHFQFFNFEHTVFVDPPARMYLVQHADDLGFIDV